LGICDVLGDASLNLSHGDRDDTSVHGFNLFVDLGVMITCVVDEDNTHDAVEVIGILVVDGDTSFILKRLTNSPLEKILVEVRKEQGVQWSLTLLEGIEVEVITHLI